jgi:hypothetical protein
MGGHREDDRDHELQLSRYEARVTVLQNEVAVLRHALRVLTGAIQRYDVPVNAPVIQQKAYSALCEALFRALALAGVEDGIPAAHDRIPSKKTSSTVSFALSLERAHSSRKPSGGYTEE